MPSQSLREPSPPAKRNSFQWKRLEEIRPAIKQEPLILSSESSGKYNKSVDWKTSVRWRAQTFPVTSALFREKSQIVKIKTQSKCGVPSNILRTVLSLSSKLRTRVFSMSNPEGNPASNPASKQETNPEGIHVGQANPGLQLRNRSLF